MVTYSLTYVGTAETKGGGRKKETGSAFVIKLVQMRSHDSSEHGCHIL